MGDMIATVGALRFALRREEHSATVPEFEARPFALMPDGTEIQLLNRNGENFLLIDHRHDADLRTRVEFWECLDRGEGSVTGLYTLANSGRSIVRREPVAS